MAWDLRQVLVHVLGGEVMMHLGLNSSGRKKESGLRLIKHMRN